MDLSRSQKKLGERRRPAATRWTEQPTGWLPVRKSSWVAQCEKCCLWKFQMVQFSSRCQQYLLRSWLFEVRLGHKEKQLCERFSPVFRPCSAVVTSDKCSSVPNRIQKYRNRRSQKESLTHRKRNRLVFCEEWWTHFQGSRWPLTQWFTSGQLPAF